MGTESKAQALARLDEFIAGLKNASFLLQAGRVIHTNRKVRSLFSMLRPEDSYEEGALVKICARLRKGEQLDADAELDALHDRMKSFRQELIEGILNEQKTEANPGTQPQNDNQLPQSPSSES